MKPSTAYSIVAGVLITLSGCNFFHPVESNESNDDPFVAQDGNAGTIALELNDMGDAAMELFGGRSSTQDTINIDITIVPWHYESGCKGWVREAEGTFEGGSVTRYDTVWFYDGNDFPIQYPTLATLSHYKHVRSVNGTYQNSFDYRYVMDVELEKSADDTVFVFNGNITGQFNGEVFHTVEISNVKRRLIHIPYRWLSFPFEGTISIDRPLRTVFIEFGGANTAQVIVTRKSDGKTWVFIINITTGKEFI